MTIAAINPATGETIREYRAATSRQIRRAIETAHDAYREWRRVPFADRARHFRQAGAILRERAGEYGRLMAAEMGKPISQGQAEAEKCAWACEYYADEAEHFLASEPVATDASKSLVVFEPLGVILAIMPWNFPFWQVFRFAAPSLMAGNATVLKHAPNVPGAALAIEEIFREAGFPKNLFRTVLAETRQAKSMIKHPLVRAVTLTGSVRAGRAVAKQAGELIKKTVLELGGSDAYVILEDADLDRAVPVCVASRLTNSGQSCIAAKRFIVVRAQRAEFERRMVEGMRAAPVGDPMAGGTKIGPLARMDLRETLHRQVAESLAQGATCLLGGTVPPGPGAFYPPTVLTGVAKGMPAFDEELFGPVAAIVPVEDEAEAIAVANDSAYGLGGAVFTRDLAKGERIATHELEAGACFVNAQVRSDPRLPFGGIKESGYGRELSVFGIREFVNVKAVSIA